MRFQTLIRESAAMSSFDVNFAKKDIMATSKYVVFDLDSVGSLPEGKRLEKENLDEFPHILKFSWLVVDDEKNILKERECIVKPQWLTDVSDDFELSHGVSFEKAMEDGVDLDSLLDEFLDDVRRDGVSVVGHDVLSFDYYVLFAEVMRRYTDFEWLYNKDVYDTTDMAVRFKICNQLFKDKGEQISKRPSLEELYLALFEEEVTAPRGTLQRTHTCLKCFDDLMLIVAEINMINAEKAKRIKRMKNICLLIAIVFILVIAIMLIK